MVGIPLTDYSRFGVWCAQFTNGAGEDIRYLTRDQAQAEKLPAHDYWLFDSRKLVQMHFDDEDHFLGGEIISDPAHGRAAQLLARCCLAPRSATG